jgi:hypothetical protein
MGSSARVAPEINLSRVLRWEGRSVEAIQRFQTWLPDHPADEPYGLILAMEHGWLCRELRDPAPALTDVDARLVDADGKYRIPALLIERAKLLVALDRKDEAEQALAEYLRLAQGASALDRFRIDAALLLGFLREKRGDVAGAREIWTSSFEWTDSEKRSAVQGTGGLVGMMNFLIVGVLAEKITEQELESLLTSHLRSDRRSETIFSAVGSEHVRHASQAIYRMWLTPEGRELAWRLACHDLSFVDEARLPSQLMITELARIELFPDEFTAEQRQLIEETAERGFEAVRRGKINLVQLPLLATAYKHGNIGPLGWGLAGPMLPSDLRGPVAYLLAQRFRRLSRPSSEVRQLLKSALNDAPADSLLKRLAQRDLDK